MIPYSILYGHLWPRALPHSQHPGLHPTKKDEAPPMLIDLTPTDGGRKPNAGYRKDFQESCVNILRLLANTPGLTRYGMSALIGRHGHRLVSALQGLQRCGYIHTTELVNGRAAWFVTEKGNDYLKD